MFAKEFDEYSTNLRIRSMWSVPCRYFSKIRFLASEDLSCYMRLKVSASCRKLPNRLNAVQPLIAAIITFRVQTNMQSLNILDLAQASIDSIVLSHQIYMFAIWSVLVELPRLLIRYGKVTANNYLNLHSISMTLLACITIYYAVVMIILFNNSGAQERASSI